ncbi:Low molecular weight protein-tyrosine-phosphatase YfkJ [Tepidimonas alkaliphilus]|uniref:Low molecular weight protein-tyrosine-phosphatase YfkJ n=1 Tax=Tepidimonas alkaliphilus TaxID=2588942 RepID=A0A554W4B9_9BURK|nr:low molecular weight protein-tyrosine-phosphatase [Tepidimonas alkaliphilus]TSE18424.1 Low molecular weight protein-tyrosine-phosphatase YfkJ [Tepidimonas alkaliphilus]
MLDDNRPLRVLMICMGNICRSPTAHGMLRQRLRQRGLQGRILVDSAGTHGYHVGQPPDPRAQAHARARGLDLSDLRARRLTVQDCERHDWLLVMDADNEAAVRALCPPLHQHKIHRLARFARRHAAHEVPDPYYGGPDGFELVLDLVEDAVDGWLDHVLSLHPHLDTPAQ